MQFTCLLVFFTSVDGTEAAVFRGSLEYFESLNQKIGINLEEYRNEMMYITFN